VRKPPHTEKRGGQWWYRRRVPTALVSILGFAEYRESLRTPDINEARIRASIRDAEVTVELQAAKELLKKQQVSDPTTQALLNLTPEALTYIRDAVRAHTLRVDEEFRRAQPDEDSLFAYESSLGEQHESSGKALALGRVPTSPSELGMLQAALDAVGVQVPPKAAGWQEVIHKALEGYNRALQDIRSRIHGDYVSTPAAPLKPPQIDPKATSGGDLLLGKVIDDYVASVKQSGYTRKVKRCLQLFGVVIGRDTPVKEIRQKVVTQFLRDICKLPSNWAHLYDRGTPVASMMAMEHEECISPATYRDNYRAPLGAFLIESLRDHGDCGFPGLTVDRIEYVGIRKDNEEQQRALTEPELKKLIEGPKFAAMAQDPEQESMYWFTVLSLFTGARPRELCQVNPQVDFGQHEGHWYVDLSPHTAAGKGIKKSVKTDEERRIPLHPELVSLGFPEYVERIKGQGADRLFPSFRVKKGNPFEAAGDDFTALLKDVGLYDDKAPPGQVVLGAYVMRKTFITLCRNQGVVSKEITGHSDGTTTAIQDRSYIFGPEPFAKKLAELGKYKLPVVVPERRSQSQRQSL
jgi:integrase